MIQEIVDGVAITLENEFDTFSYDLNILQNDVMDNIAPKAHEHANATVLDAITGCFPRRHAGRQY